MPAARPSATQQRLEAAHRLVARVAGQVALAIARRRVAPAAEQLWASQLRDAANLLAAGDRDDHSAPQAD